MEKNKRRKNIKKQCKLEINLRAILGPKGPPTVRYRITRLEQIFLSR